MIATLKNIINHLAHKLKILFLIDSIGALLTAFLLLVILKYFNGYFKMPKAILIYLSIIAIFFSIYSATCFFLLKENWIPFIRIIYIANLLYCILTLGILLNYYSIITTICVIYFLLEIVIICGLVYIEYNVALKLKV